MAKHYATGWNRVKQHFYKELVDLIGIKGEKAARKMYETQWKRAVREVATKRVEAKAHYDDLKARYPHIESHRDRLRAAIDEDNERVFRNRATVSGTALADTSPERIKALKAIMQQEHPDKDGDEDVFHGAKKELENIRKALKS